MNRSNPVAQAGSLPYRGLPIRKLLESPSTPPVSNRRYGRLTICATLAALLLLGLPARAQFSIPWFTVDGGGGSSSGGPFTVTGTIGQPDAGPTLSGGPFTLSGGFWALPQAVQTPGAPTLSITNSGPGLATIYWAPDTGTNWLLQEALSVSGPWSNASSGWTNPVTVPATWPTKFYRLFKP